MSDEMEITSASSSEALLREGLKAWEQGQREEALRRLRQAVGADLRRPEPWYWMGCLYEEAIDRVSAAYCYYLANDTRQYLPALAALRRLGYLDLTVEQP